MNKDKIERSIYLQDAFYVAKNVILGSYLYTNIGGVLTGGIITEVEVYIGAYDKAAHSYKNKKTKRTEIQFGKGGYAYVFLVYGIHYQFCVVTNDENAAEVVLIRSIEPVTGIDAMEKRRGVKEIAKLTTGPGNVCKALGITREHYGEDLCADIIYLCHNENRGAYEIAETKRVGIDYAEEYAEKPWRYYIKGNKFVTRIGS